MENSEITKVSNVRAYYKIFGGGEDSRYVRAVDDISFSLYNSEILGIAGESGCGKSTLIKVLYGLVDPPLVLLNGDVIYRIGDEEISIRDRRFKRKVQWKVCSYIPQSSMSVLNPVMRIKDHFFKIIQAHFRDIDERELYEDIEKHVQRLGLPVEALTSFPHQLSGGMRQRVVIALATFLKPRVILADEPTTALDVINQRGVLQLLIRIQREMRNTVVIVTHDMGVHAQTAQRLMVMYAGKIVELASTEEIFKNSYHPYVRILIDSLPFIGDKKRRPSLKGRPPSLLNPPSGCRFHPRCPFAEDACKRGEPPLVEVSYGHYVSCFKWERM
jgi:peptide/nickel transport system ATP-binding protein